jgi:CHRD domain
MRTPRIALGAAIVVVAAGASLGTVAAADDDASPSDASTLSERLTGYQEDPAPISTTGTGRFRASIDESRDRISYRLSFSGLEAPAAQAHIHFGGRAQSGGISVFLCSNLGNGPAGTQACPAGGGTISGTIQAGDVVGPEAQGIAPGEFDELVDAIRAGKTYVNVHSSLYPAGEIRAQLDGHVQMHH